MKYTTRLIIMLSFSLIGHININFAMISKIKKPINYITSSQLHRMFFLHSGQQPIASIPKKKRQFSEANINKEDILITLDTMPALIKPGNTPLLHRMLLGNNIEIVEKLLTDQHIDINVRNDNQQTPLMLACALSCIGIGPKKYEIIKKIVQKKADLNAQDEDGKTALIYFLEYIQKKALQKMYLYSRFNVAKLPGYSSVIDHTDIQILEFLLQQPDINIKLKTNKKHSLFGISAQEFAFDARHIVPDIWQCFIKYKLDT